MKLRSLSILLPAAAVLTGCTGGVESGTYSGTADDAAKSKLTVTLSKTGDGLVTGLWEMEGKLGHGVIESSAANIFGSRELSIRFDSKDCSAASPIELKTKDAYLIGSVPALPQCSVTALTFSLPVQH